MKQSQVRVIGIGGAGGSAVGRLVQAGLGSLQLAVADTDQVALNDSAVPTRIRFGDKLTGGRGADGNPRVGERGAEESAEDFFHFCYGADLVFVVAGLGGGTGTGAAPVVAEIAQNCGALTIGVVTKPFVFEGARRRHRAEQSLARLQEKIHALIVLPCERVLRIVEKRTSVEAGFGRADAYVCEAVRAIAQLVVEPTLIRLDLDDLRSVLADGGPALFTTADSRGLQRATDAALAAIASPVPEAPLEGARGALISIRAGPDLMLHEIHVAAKVVRSALSSQANVAFGAAIDAGLVDTLRVSVVAVHDRLPPPPDVLSCPLGPRSPGDGDAAEPLAPGRVPRRPRPGSLSGDVRLWPPRPPSDQRAEE
jgi:cell division protein FtsZ